jgi:hypothetical protein
MDPLGSLLKIGCEWSSETFQPKARGIISHKSHLLMSVILSKIKVSMAVERGSVYLLLIFLLSAPSSRKRTLKTIV